MIKLFGRYRLIVENCLTGGITDTGWQDNLVLNGAFTVDDTDMNAVSWYLRLGSGSTPPTPSDTTLESFLYGTFVSAPYSGLPADFNSPIYSTTSRFSHNYATGEVIGNVSEIGMSATALITRALITDALGDPTTITLGVNDKLTVSYDIGYEIDTSHPAGSIQLTFDDGVNTPVVLNATAKWCDLGRGANCRNLMNGKVLPMFCGDNSSVARVVDDIPSDPLGDINGGVQGITYTGGTISTGSWKDGVVATGSSWTKEISVTSGEGEHTGNWNGLTVTSGAGYPVMLFEFDTTFVKLSNQIVDITLKYEVNKQ